MQYTLTHTSTEHTGFYSYPNYKDSVNFTCSHHRNGAALLNTTCTYISKLTNIVVFIQFVDACMAQCLCLSTWAILGTCRSICQIWVTEERLQMKRGYYYDVEISSLKGVNLYVVLYYLNNVNMCLNQCKIRNYQTSFCFYVKQFKQ